MEIFSGRIILSPPLDVCPCLTNSISRFGFRVASEAKEEEGDAIAISSLLTGCSVRPSLRSSSSSFGQFIWPAPPPLPHRSASQIGLKVSQ